MQFNSPIFNTRHTNLKIINPELSATNLETASLTPFLHFLQLFFLSRTLAFF